MKPTAQHNKVNISARKARRVTDLIRGLSVIKAQNVLKYTPQKASPIIQKLILTAVNNWNQNSNHKKKENQGNKEEQLLYIKNIFVNEGRMLKRIQPAPQGRAHRIRKRSAHINIILDSATSEKNIEGKSGSEINKDYKVSTRKEEKVEKKTEANGKKNRPITPKEKNKDQKEKKIKS